ncbi:hypothetical protein OG562_12370 [Streptomyces sp. NBC_01275]|uniref:hypothetical protein n=1 Tax=Streptomyces sp. NBC_01275 TaxID=2903807 RepID=UPI00224DA03B|nr:hypothetical protein [Streptomyces sp. NBC_01275]MCX4761755.1 hypothetical protein [Streptomyces sp. NBC_01275]
MLYLFMGILGMYAGVRALGLRRRQLSAAAAPSPQLILRPAVLAVLAGIAIVGGAFLLAGGVVVLVQG